MSYSVFYQFHISSGSQTREWYFKTHHAFRNDQFILEMFWTRKKLKITNVDLQFWHSFELTKFKIVAITKMNMYKQNEVRMGKLQALLNTLPMSIEHETQLRLMDRQTDLTDWQKNHTDGMDRETTGQADE